MVRARGGAGVGVEGRGGEVRYEIVVEMAALGDFMLYRRRSILRSSWKPMQSIWPSTPRVRGL